MAAEKEDPPYLLGETGVEIERLRKQHKWIQTCTNGKIVFAPVDLQKPDLRVLDVGCADGTLLRDLRTQVAPTAQLIGTDIMKSFLPESPDGNITYNVGDLNQPNVSQTGEGFDFTHVRYVMAAGAGSGVEQCVKNLADTLRPGGWLQCQELDLAPSSQEEVKSWSDITTMMRIMFDKIGVGKNYAGRLEEYFKNAGLVNVVAKPLPLPIGKKMGSEEAARNSLIPFKITIPTLRGAAEGLKLDLPEGLFDNLEERWEDDMLREGGYFTAVMVYGQKSE